MNRGTAAQQTIEQQPFWVRLKALPAGTTPRGSHLDGNKDWNLRDTSSTWPGRNTNLVQVAIAIAAAAILGYLAPGEPVIGAILTGLAVAIALPLSTLTLAIAWVVLCRPGQELVHFSGGGLTLTEVDLLPMLAFVAALNIRNSSGTTTRIRITSIVALIAWPAWYILRAAMPSIGISGFGSPLVDVRNITMYVVLLPLLILIRRRGWQNGLKLLCYAGYTACGIAIVSWALLVLGIVPAQQTSLVNYLAANDVRPGGEILIVILAILLCLGEAPILLRSPLLSWVLVVGEILVSQTLSIAIAVAVGGAVGTLLKWKTLRFGPRLMTITASILLALVALGSVAGESRFDLAGRISGESAQYRVQEFGIVGAVLSSSPLVAAVGTGPGSILVVKNVYTHLNESKRDTHDVFANVALKTGLVGLALYLLPVGLVLWQLRRKGTLLARALAGVLCGLCVLSLTVPFIWTASGLTAFLLFDLLALVYARSIDKPGLSSISENTKCTG